MNSFMLALRLIPGTRLLVLAVLLVAGLLALGTARRSVIWQTLHDVSGGVVPNRAPFSLGALVTGTPGLPPPAPAPVSLLPLGSAAASNVQTADDVRRRLLERMKAEPALRGERATHPDV